MTPAQRRIAVIAMDTLFFLSALAATCLIFLDDSRSAGHVVRAVFPVLPYWIFFATLLALVLKVPNVDRDTLGSRSVIALVISSFGTSAIGAGLLSLTGFSSPTGFFVFLSLGLFFLMLVGRVAILQVNATLQMRAHDQKRVLIYGAGSAGIQLATALRSHREIRPVGFVDDSPTLQGMVVAGLPIYRAVEIERIMRDKQVKRVILAMPSLSTPKQMRLARSLINRGLEVQALPPFSQFLGQKTLVDRLSPVEAQSFLGRAPLAASLQSLQTSYEGRSVLVTGAGGSIGSELCRQVLTCRPKRLVLLELSEPALYSINQELGPLADATPTEIVPVLGSVADASRMQRILRENDVQVVLHAAAYKHVPLVESNAVAGLENNVLGTAILAQEAVQQGVERLILISSDKAVNPVNTMGVSKKLAELVVKDLATRSTGTALSIVRFGNVLGSSGSVVPLFQEQIRRGGPVTVTDPKVARYFMTLEEAVQLVLTAGGMASGGETFVLDMGVPVPIVDLARQMIRDAGFSVQDASNPAGDIGIKFTGLRAGEKLCEELTASSELVLTAHEKILSAREPGLSEIEVAGMIKAITAVVRSGDQDAARALVGNWLSKPDPAQEHGAR